MKTSAIGFSSVQPQTAAAHAVKTADAVAKCERAMGSSFGRMARGFVRGGERSGTLRQRPNCVNLSLWALLSGKQRLAMIRMALAKNILSIPNFPPCKENAALDLRVGHGHDTHRFTRAEPDPRRRAIEYERGLDGHSDADVLLHAITDALSERPDWAISVNGFPIAIRSGRGRTPRPCYGPPFAKSAIEIGRS